MSTEPSSRRGRARHEQPASIRARVVSVLLGVSWVAAMIAAFVIGVALTGTSGPERPDLPRWQEPGFGAAVVGGGMLSLAFAAGAEITLLRDRRRYSDARRLRSLGYRTIPQALLHNLWQAPISVGFIVLGLWLRHRYG